MGFSSDSFYYQFDLRYRVYIEGVSYRKCLKSGLNYRKKPRDIEFEIICMCVTLRSTILVRNSDNIGKHCAIMDNVYIEYTVLDTKLVSHELGISGFFRFIGRQHFVVKAIMDYLHNFRVFLYARFWS